MTRSCDGCTKCCEGWLWGVAHGKRFWPGRPCHFMTSNGCKIYESRPEDPCKTFKCLWLTDEKIPEWMKPDKVNAIIRWSKDYEKDFIEITEAGSTLDPKILSWFFIEYAMGEISHLKYQLNGGWNYIFPLQKKE